MRFGFMDHLACAEWQSEGQRYHDILAQIELGDKLGFDTAWLAEIHFFPNVSRLASPLTVLAAAAQRTQRIRLGTAVTLLPLQGSTTLTVCDATSGECDQATLSTSTSIVPEPDTLILLGIGLVACAVIFRRRWKGPK